MADTFAHSTVQCLAAIAQHRGIRVNPERLIHDFALGDQLSADLKVERFSR